MRQFQTICVFVALVLILVAAWSLVSSLSEGLDRTQQIQQRIDPELCNFQNWNPQSSGWEPLDMRVPGLHDSATTFRGQVTRVDRDTVDVEIHIDGSQLEYPLQISYFELQAGYEWVSADLSLDGVDTPLYADVPRLRAEPRSAYLEPGQHLSFAGRARFTTKSRTSPVEDLAHLVRVWARTTEPVDCSISLLAQG